jgi:hypothetical protein
MQALVTRMIASVGSTMAGSGTFSTRTSWALYMTVARIDLPPEMAQGCGSAQVLKR